MRWALLVRQSVLASCAVAAAVGLTSANRPASAAVLSSITYDITSGDFGNIYAPAFVGPATGVSVKFIPPGGSYSYTGLAQCTGAPACGQLQFHQTGPSVTSLAVTQFTVPVQAFLLSANKFTAFYTYFYSTSTPPVNIWWVVKANSGAGTAHTGYDFPNTALAASYIIGNEIRLPEPSTQLGLASGLLLLGTLAALRTRRRARLH